MKEILRRIWLPGLLFVVLCSAYLFGEEFESDRVRIGINIGIWLSGAWLLVGMINYFFWHRLVREALGRPVPRLLTDGLAMVVYVSALCGILAYVFELSITGIWATSGMLGIVVGLALRSIILDIFTGLAVNIDQSYRIGDWVELLDHGHNVVYGKVLEINWRTTRVVADDHRFFVIPNSRMGNVSLINYSMPDDIFRAEVPFTLDFSVPPARALRVLEAGVRAVCGRKIGPLAHPEPKVIIGATNGLGIEYRVRYWMSLEQITIPMCRHVVYGSVLEHLRHAGLTLAYPKQDQFFARMPVRQLEHQSEQDREKLLRRIDIFGCLEPAELRQVAAELAPKHIPAGSELLAGGEAGDSMFVVAEGFLEVWAEREGEKIRIGQIEPGEFAGEMSLLTGEPRTASISAATDVVAYEITRDHLMPILEARPALFEAISALTAARRMRMEETLAAAGIEDGGHDVHGLTAQILGKMKSFFRHIAARRHRAPAKKAKVGE